MESAAWSGWVKRLFKRHHGEEIAPKTLRSVFITWLRDQTTAPDILKSAAHAMKHSEQRQGSADYDQESDDRLVKAAYEFNLTYASGFTAESGSSGGEGSSSLQRLPRLLSMRAERTALPPCLRLRCLRLLSPCSSSNHRRQHSPTWTRRCCLP